MNQTNPTGIAYTATSKDHIRINLAKWYLHHGMPTRLAESVIVCGYLEHLLDGIPPAETARLKPVFDVELDLLRNDWLLCRYFDLWRNLITGEIMDSPPPGDGEPLPEHIEHLPEQAQRSILFARFGDLFR
jgi:hypothetical protein